MAGNEDIKIKTITKASIKLDPLVALDRTEDGKYTKEATWDVDAKEAGFFRPYIRINGFRVDPGITNFVLDTNGFLPTCNFTFVMQDGLFLSASYPKDGDIFSLYIRAIGDVYKPIRMDFNILSVDGTPLDNPVINNSDGNRQVFTILGECRIPGLYTQVTRSFRDKTSYETLLAVSQELGLGFSSNDDAVTDSMTWICPNFSYYDFIKDVAKHAYKDEYSYFDVWIDPYYNLNFVNLGTQFSKDIMLPDTIMAALNGNGIIDMADDSGIPGAELRFVEMPLILNNLEQFISAPTYLVGYTMLSDSGQFSNKDGYVTNVQFYDVASQDGDSEESNGYVKYDIEAITTDKITENIVVQKGRPTENLYRGEKRVVWLGSNRSGENANSHSNYIHAKVQNEINIVDSMKFNLNLEFTKYMPFIYKGQVVPVEIYVIEKGIRKINAGSSDEGNTLNDDKEVLDFFLSGLYVVSGFEVVYNKRTASLRQRLNLRKKTWHLNSSGNFPKFFPNKEEGINGGGINSERTVITLNSSKAEVESSGNATADIVTNSSSGIVDANKVTKGGGFPKKINIGNLISSASNILNDVIDKINPN